VDVAWIAAPLMADLQQLSGAAGGQDHFPCTLKGIGHLLFTVHVQAGIQTIHRLRCMPEIRRGNDHRVQILFLREHVLIVGVGVQLVPVLLQKTIRTLQIVLAPDIAHGLESDIGDLQAGVQEHLSLRSRSDQGNVHFVGGGSFLASLFFPLGGQRREQDARSRGRSVAQKAAPVNSCHGYLLSFRWFGS